MPTHKETAFVHEKTKDEQTVWQGYVEVFNLTGHKEAETCYAWEHAYKNRRVKIISVLGSHLIDSATKAIQAAIFMDQQPPVRAE